MDIEELRPLLDELSALARDIEASPARDAESASHLIPEHRRRAEGLHRRLRRLGPLRIVTHCHGFDDFGYTITAKAQRTFRVGSHVIARWSLEICGEARQFGAGLWTYKDEEPLPYPLPLLDALHDYGNFPTDWFEALEILGEDDEDEPEDGEYEPEDGETED